RPLRVSTVWVSKRADHGRQRKEGVRGRPGRGRIRPGDRRVWPSVITFDCYGALVRWPETLRACFATFLPDGADVAAFHRDFNERQAELRREPYRPYTVMLRRGLLDTLAAWGLPAAADAPERFVQALRAIPPYPDVLSALNHLPPPYPPPTIPHPPHALLP